MFSASSVGQLQALSGRSSPTSSSTTTYDQQSPVARPMLFGSPKSPEGPGTETPKAPLLSFDTVPACPGAPRKGKGPPGYFDLSGEAPIRRLSFNRMAAQMEDVEELDDEDDEMSDCEAEAYSSPAPDPGAAAGLQRQQLFGTHQQAATAAAATAAAAAAAAQVSLQPHSVACADASCLGQREAQMQAFAHLQHLQQPGAAAAGHASPLPSPHQQQQGMQPLPPWSPFPASPAGPLQQQQQQQQQQQMLQQQFLSPTQGHWSAGRAGTNQQPTGPTPVRLFR